MFSRKKKIKNKKNWPDPKSEMLSVSTIYVYAYGDDDEQEHMFYLSLWKHEPWNMFSN